MWPRENFVWFAADGTRSWDTANISKHFRHHALVEWNLLDSWLLESLSCQNWEKPSRLLLFMREHPAVFPVIEKDPERVQSDWIWSSASGSSGGIPDWDGRHWDEDDGESESRDENTKERPSRLARGYSVKYLNLANGQAEFDRLVQRVPDDMNGRIILMNWMAQRRSRRPRPSERQAVVYSVLT